MTTELRKVSDWIYRWFTICCDKQVEEGDECCPKCSKPISFKKYPTSIDRDKSNSPHCPSDHAAWDEV